MKNKIMFPVILFAGILFINVSVNQAYGQTPPKNKTVTKETVKYTCPMHSEVMKDKAGKCPKCGMELVVKKDKKSEMMGDSTMMKKDHTKMMQDTSSMMKKGHMMHDTVSMKHKKTGM